MSKPKILTMFDETAEGSIYSKLNNPVTTTVIDRSLIVSGITDAHNNSIVTFKPGCDSSDVDSITINGDVYTIQDSLGNVVTGNTGMWINGATISVALDTTNKAAYILNNNYSITETLTKPFCITLTEDSEGVITADRTDEEIQAAYNAGDFIFTKLGQYIYPLVGKSSGFTLLYFNSIVGTTSKRVIHTLSPYRWSITTYNLSKKSTKVELTLSASSWTGDSAPYTYTLSVTDVTKNSNQELLPALNITSEQLTALQAANIQDGGQSADTIVLKAFGDKPTIDIPIRVIMRGDA